MDTNYVRLLSIELNNFKNVGYGKIEFSHKPSVCSNESPKSEILGIYGQNGSGKTAVIEALDFLQKLMQGESIPSDARNYISTTKDKAIICFQFHLKSDKEEFYTWYKFSLAKDNNNDVLISSEELSFSDLKLKRKTRCTLIKYDQSNEQTFSPTTRYNELYSEKKENEIKIGVARSISKREKRSFIFSNELHELWELSQNPLWNSILLTLHNYAFSSLFVIQNKQNGIININFAIPISFKYEDEKKLSMGTIPVSLNEPAVFDVEKFNLVKKIVEDANVVMEALIPNLSIKIKEYGSQLTATGKEGIRFELVSIHNNETIPLRYESEGIKKIISIINLIITMYNNTSVCVAIDELDAGIFEYLLGELLSVIEETGKGQFIFTSHNLRPLEMIDNHSLLFTTTNPNNRYIRITNVKSTNNLRNLYIRSICLGGQKEPIYEQTETFKIRNALRKAGRQNNE